MSVDRKHANEAVGVSREQHPDSSFGQVAFRPATCAAVVMDDQSDEACETVGRVLQMQAARLLTLYAR